MIYLWQKRKWNVGCSGCLLFWRQTISFFPLLKTSWYLGSGCSRGQILSLHGLQSYWIGKFWSPSCFYGIMAFPWRFLLLDSLSGTAKHWTCALTLANNTLLAKTKPQSLLTGSICWDNAETFGSYLVLNCFKLGSSGFCLIMCIAQSLSSITALVQSNQSCLCC